MTYTLIANWDGVKRDVDGASIPADPDNIDWQVYRGWLAAGNSPSPAPAVIPTIVTAAQAKIALYKAGLIDTVESAIRNNSDRSFSIYYDNAAQWDRNNPIVVALGRSIGLDEAGIDRLFLLAAEVAP